MQCSFHYLNRMIETKNICFLLFVILIFISRDLSVKSQHITENVCKNLKKSEYKCRKVLPIFFRQINCIPVNFLALYKIVKLQVCHFVFVIYFSLLASPTLKANNVSIQSMSSFSKFTVFKPYFHLFILVFFGQLSTFLFNLVIYLLFMFLIDTSQFYY